jgi:restriction system protein
VKSASRTNFDDLSGGEFETRIASILKQHGFVDVGGTPATGDQGADLIAKMNGKTIVIQAKRYQGVVGNKAVQEVIGARHYYCADEAWVITNSSFSASAKDLAQRSQVTLIDGHYLRQIEPFLDKWRAEHD